MSSPRTPVRRILFPSIEQAIEEGEIDNVANVLQEEIRSGRSESSNRWGFDFEQERPIPDGPYHWVRINANGQEENFEEDSEEATADEALESNGDVDITADFDTGTAPIDDHASKETSDLNENVINANSATKDIKQ